MSDIYKKTVLCFGDSNTYGFNPENHGRYDEEMRWTGRLQRLLGEEYKVVEEGCNGRTTVFADPADPWKMGKPYLKPCLNTHKPVSIVIMMLGTNDLKKCYNASAEDIASGVEELINEIYEFADSKQLFRPKVIVVSPPLLGENADTVQTPSNFDKSAVERSGQLAALYRSLADRYGCLYYDAAVRSKVSETDQVHLSAEGHRNLAEGLYEVVKQCDCQ